MKKHVLIKSIVMFLCALVFCGCVCQHTHVTGRPLGHGEDPDCVDSFFCVLDYLLFTPEGEWRDDESRDEQIRREQLERRNSEREQRRQERNNRK